MNLVRTLEAFETEAQWLAARTQDVTSTEAAALFDLSPYTTPFELWHEKAAGARGNFEETDRMKWGKRLQDSIAQGIAEDVGLYVKPLANVYGRVMPVRMGASFDFSIESCMESAMAAHNFPPEPGLLEIKKVDELIFRQQWVDEETRAIEAPKHIEIQLQHQLEVMDRAWGMIGVLIGGNRVHWLFRLRDEEMGALIRARCAAFWESIANGEPPRPDLAKDAKFIAKLYGYAEPGRVYDGRNDDELVALCREYKAAAEVEKSGKEDKDRAKSAILMKLGDNERALVRDGFTISAGMVGPADISYHRDGYRSFRITESKKARLAA